MLFFSFQITNHSNSARRRHEEGNTSSSHPFSSRPFEWRGGDVPCRVEMVRKVGCPLSPVSTAPETTLSTGVTGACNSSKRRYGENNQWPLSPPYSRTTTPTLVCNTRRRGILLAAHHRPLITHHTIPPSLELEVDAAASSKVRPLFYFISFL